MEQDNKTLVYVYFINNDEPVILKATGYYEQCFSDGDYYVVANHDNQEIARFNKVYVKGIAKQ